MPIGVGRLKRRSQGTNLLSVGGYKRLLVSGMYLVGQRVCRVFPGRGWRCGVPGCCSGRAVDPWLMWQRVGWRGGSSDVLPPGW